MSLFCLKTLNLLIWDTTFLPGQKPRCFRMQPSHSKAAPTGSSSHLELHLDLPVCHLLILLTFAKANLYHTSLNCHSVLSQTPYKSLGYVASTSELVNLECDQKLAKSSLNCWKLVLTAFLPGPRRAQHLFSLGSPSQH